MSLSESRVPLWRRTEGLVPVPISDAGKRRMFPEFSRVFRYYLMACFFRRFLVRYPYESKGLWLCGS